MFTFQFTTTVQHWQYSLFFFFSSHAPTVYQQHMPQYLQKGPTAPVVIFLWRQVLLQNIVSLSSLWHGAIETSVYYYLQGKMTESTFPDICQDTDMLWGKMMMKRSSVWWNVQNRMTIQLCKASCIMGCHSNFHSQLFLLWNSGKWSSGWLWPEKPWRTLNLRH